MDNKPKIRGVTIRKHISGDSIQIEFQFMGTRCTPTLIGVSATPKGGRFAERMLEDIKEKISAGNFNFSDYPSIADYPKAKLFGHVNTITLADYSDTWIRQVEHVRPHSTATTYKKALNRILKNLGTLQVRNINHGHIKRMILDDFCTIKAKTIRNYLLPLRAMLKEALNEQIISINPLNTIELDGLTSDQQKLSDYEVDPFTRDEIDTILATASDEARFNYQYLFFTGVRLSEYMALEWDCIDWKKKTQHIRRALVMGEEKGTKTKASNRVTHLLPKAIEALEGQKQFTWFDQSRKPKVFRRLSDGRRLFDYEHISRPWKTLLHRCKVRYRNPYQMRHTFASQLLSDGENAHFVADLLGHKGAEMVYRVYGKWIPKDEVKFISDYGSGEK